GGKPSVVFVNRSYWPDVEATGQLLTELAEDLRADFDVSVCCGLPNVTTGDGGEDPSHADRRGVSIDRVRHTRFSKRTLAGRLVNFVTFAAGVGWKLLTGRRPDLYVAETDPFLLPPLVAAVAAVRRRPFVCYLQDLQPGVAVAVGVTPAGGVAARVMTWLADFAYRRAAKVVVLSSDMADTVVARGVPRSRIEVVPNWADTASIRPAASADVRAVKSRMGLHGTVVMHSGNMGLTQRLETTLDAAAILQKSADPLARAVTFALVGDGAKRASLESRAAELGLANVRFLPYQPKQTLAAAFGVAELHLISTDPDAIRHLMPSKLYGILAAGRPVLAVAPAWCELARTVAGEGVGVFVEPGDPRELASAILRSLRDRDESRARGLRARALAEAEYDRRVVTARFGRLLASVLGEETAAYDLSSRRAA
ncbi:MAG: glycosyltransferase family 4 protein, partial [Planctomycetota bacterium]